jgi:hypothetical protein
MKSKPASMTAPAERLPRSAYSFCGESSNSVAECTQVAKRTTNRYRGIGKVVGPKNCGAKQ